MIPAPQYAVGNATYYAPWSMEATANIRGMSLDGFLDGVSLMSPADIGETVWIRRPNHDWEGPFLVADCAQGNDIWPAIYYKREIIEVGFVTAVNWGLARLTNTGWEAIGWRVENVQVWKGETRPTGDIGEPVHYPDWWLWQVEWLKYKDSRIYGGP